MKFLFFLFTSFLIFFSFSCKKNQTSAYHHSLNKWFIGESSITKKELLDKINDSCIVRGESLVPNCNLDKILPKLDSFQDFYAPLKKGIIYSEKKNNLTIRIMKKDVPNNLHLFVNDGDWSGSILVILYTYNVNNELTDSLPLYHYYMNEELLFYSQLLYYIDDKLHITTADLFVGEEGYSIKSYKNYQIDSATAKINSEESDKNHNFNGDIKQTKL